MISYYVVNMWDKDIKLVKVPDDYWFSNPIKKEGYKHELMSEICFIDHWRKSKSLSFSVSCTMYFYKYGNRVPITINGWTFYPDKIRGKYALSRYFYGMEMWFNCDTPNGQRIEWYCNFSAANHEEFIKLYFKEINRISKYKTFEDAKAHTYIDPKLKVLR